VWHLRFGVLAVLAILLVASGSALAAKSSSARFRVTLTAALTKTWTVTRSAGEPGCVVTSESLGKWQANLAGRSAGRIRVVSAGRDRVRFVGVIRALAGSATQSGTNSVVGQGAPPCGRQTKTVRCEVQRRSFRGASTTLTNPRRRVLVPARLKGVGVLRSFSPQCPEEPSEVASIRTDLPLATGPLDVADFFRQNISRFFVRGDSQQTTMIAGEVEGTVHERVRWTLTFTRVG